MHEPVIADGVLRPTQVKVDLGAIAHNWRSVNAHVARPVMPILKANAYGHGLIEVARLYQKLAAPIVGVAYLEEALHLRQAGIKLPVLVLGGIVGRQLPLFLEHDLQLTASSVDKLVAIDEAAQAAGKRAKVHLKIDTGMERIGVHWYSAEQLLLASLHCTHTDVVGIFTHFANSDGLSEGEVAATQLQLERFLEVCAFYEKRGLPCPTRHAANSGAVLRHRDAWLDLVRPGILLYGCSPSVELPLSVDVRPALAWTTSVVFFKVVRGGNAVSYGSKWAPATDTRVISLPVGYGDGYARAMSGQAEVLVRGVRRPVVGRICMDQVMVDLGPDGTAYNGDEVALIGRQGDDEIRVEDLARWAGTVPHEVLTSINTRVPRLYTL
jgi:alanine racemase